MPPTTSCHPWEGRLDDVRVRYVFWVYHRERPRDGEARDEGDGGIRLWGWGAGMAGAFVGILQSLCFCMIAGVSAVRTLIRAGRLH